MASYDSGDDDGECLFAGYGHETEATVPLSNPLNPRALTPDTAFRTQPTQLLATPTQVQVAASSPVRASMTPPRPIQRGGMLAHSMAPPGTAFRAPGRSTQQSQPPRSQTVGVEFSDDEGPINVSSDGESQQIQPVKRTTFTRNGVPLNSTRQSEPIRVEESPQAKPSFSKFAYQGPPTIPQKRTADAMASAYGTSRRPREERLSSTPVKAVPVTRQVMSIDDIQDYDIRRKIKDIQNVFPESSVQDCHDALSRSRYNYEDALDKITQELERKERADKMVDLTQDTDGSQREQEQRKHFAKQNVTNTKSIQEKWGERTLKKPGQRRSIVTTSDDLPARPTEQPQKRKKLVRPPRHSSPPLPPQSPVRTAKVEEEAVIDVSSGSEAEQDAVIPDVGLGADILSMINKAQTAELVELSGQPVDVIRQVMERGPFKKLDAVRAVVVESTSTTKTGKTRTIKKPIGDRFVDVCLEMLESYRTVDRLVAECAALGRPVREEMRRYGFDVGSQGELTTLEFDHDSGIGTPSSTASADDDASPSHKRKLRQPTMMSSTVTLKDYQEVGLNWLSLLYSKRMSCILADDMGLGKTCQVIAFLAHLCESGRSSGVHLVIVPGSTLENWLREFNNFCPALNVRPYYGSQAERAELRVQLEDEIAEGQVNVIVTTYDMAMSHHDGSFLRHIEPNVCVYDEGHVLKNNQTRRYKQLMRIPAQFRLLLTGTPLQNNLQELVSLLAFMMPSVFSKHQEGLNLLFSHKAKTTDDDHAALLSKQRIDRARSMMTPFILRRKKHQVLKHLPKKISHTSYCQMTTAQRDLYKSLAAKATTLLKGSDQKVKSNVMMDLRKAAIHPLLFRDHFNDDKIKRMAKAYMRVAESAEVREKLVLEDLEVMTDFELNRFCDKFPRQMSSFKFDRDVYADSGKVRTLVEALRKHKQNGDRTLVFSQFTMVMDILEEVFENEQITFCRLDGSTKMAERQDLIDKYYQDETIQVFMLSTGAGGAGINLACANKVVIFDSSFNPHQDAQAENRAHRVGQTREVEVIKLVTEGTIEMQIQALGLTKLALDERVAGEGETQGDQSANDTKAEKQGMDLVEKMLLDGPEEGTSDMKDDFRKGLQEAGLKVAA